jgi:hypothetical protein
MELAGTIALSVFLHLYALWILFLAVMSLKRAQDAGNLSLPAKYLGFPLLAIGYILDFAANVFPFSWIVWDFPEEWTVSAHLTRLLKEGNPYQKIVCGWICKNLLNAFDPSGSHCGD